MKRLAIIGGGRMAGIYALNAREMEVESICISPIDGIIDPTLYDYVIPIDILDYDNVLKYCIKFNIDGVVSTTELTIFTAAYVANKLHLNGLDYHIAEVITNKNRNRDLINNISGLFNPKYAFIHNLDELLKLDFDYPIILKPTSKGGKRGISVLYSKDDCMEAFEYARKESQNSKSYIVEEYIEGGMECSVESLSFNGKNYIVQITEKITSGAPHCVELAHHQPANISENIKELIIETLDKGLTAIGLINGPCHTEIKIKDGKIYLIEFNARPGGDHIAYPLTELSTGYPYIKGSIKIALGEFTPIDRKELLNKHAGILFVCEQTKELIDIFNSCEKYDWFYKKNKVSENLLPITHNDGFNINYFVYCSDKLPDFLEGKL